MKRNTVVKKRKKRDTRDVHYALELLPRQQALEADLSNSVFKYADHWADVEANHKTQKANLMGSSALHPSRISKYLAIGLNKHLKSEEVRSLFVGCGIGLVYEFGLIGKQGDEAIQAALIDKELMSKITREKVVSWAIKWKTDHEATAEQNTTQGKTPAGAPLYLPKQFFAAVPLPADEVPAIVVRDFFCDLRELVEKYAEHGITVLTQPDREHERANRSTKWPVMKKVVKAFLAAEKKRIRKEKPGMKTVELAKRYDIFREENQLSKYNYEDLNDLLDSLGYGDMYQQLVTEAHAAMEEPELGPWATKIAQAEREKPRMDKVGEIPELFRKVKKIIDTSKLKFDEPGTKASVEVA